jgi:hypothetical protein
MPVCDVIFCLHRAEVVLLLKSDGSKVSMPVRDVIFCLRRTEVVLLLKSDGSKVSMPVRGVIFCLRWAEVVLLLKSDGNKVSVPMRSVIFCLYRTEKMSDKHFAMAKTLFPPDFPNKTTLVAAGLLHPCSNLITLFICSSQFVDIYLPPSTVSAVPFVFTGCL